MGDFNLCCAGLPQTKNCPKPTQLSQRFLAPRCPPGFPQYGGLVYNRETGPSCHLVLRSVYPLIAVSTLVHVILIASDTAGVRYVIKAFPIRVMCSSTPVRPIQPSYLHLRARCLQGQRFGPRRRILPGTTWEGNFVLGRDYFRELSSSEDSSSCSGSPIAPVSSIHFSISSGERSRSTPSRST